jgi:hypothetical protein
MKWKTYKIKSNRLTNRLCIIQTFNLLTQNWILFIAGFILSVLLIIRDAARSLVWMFIGRTGANFHAVVN